MYKHLLSPNNALTVIISSLYAKQIDFVLFTIMNNDATFSYLNNTLAMVFIVDKFLLAGHYREVHNCFPFLSITSKL